MLKSHKNGLCLFPVRKRHWGTVLKKENLISPTKKTAAVCCIRPQGNIPNHTQSFTTADTRDPVFSSDTVFVEPGS
jgi:hypothetical protein